MNATISAYHQQIAPHLQPLLNITELYFMKAEQEFNYRTENVHFGWFCILYSILFVILARNCMQPKRWRPHNKQIKSTKEKINEKLYSTLFSLPILSTVINGKFLSKLDQEQKKQTKDLQKHWDKRRTNQLPEQGMSTNEIQKRISEWKKTEKQIWNTGKVSGAFYCGDEQFMKEINEFAGPYMYQNPLHLDTYKQLMKMEKQLLDMTADLLTQKGSKFYGTVTSGGSQSLILVMYAYRKYYNKSKPNIVVPVTAHAALDKGGFYLNIELRKARLNNKYQVDVKHMESLIDDNTIMILGSVPNFPHGIIDPIDKIAKLAKKYKIGCHIDGCLGGFVGLFDDRYKQLYSLDREGVTSISLDQHKFALAPKGISTIFYNKLQLRHAQYYVYTDWSGGLYSTMTFPGSRSGFASAAGWYSLVKTTKKGLKQNAKSIIEATQSCTKQLKAIPQIQMFGEPKLCVIGFTAKQPLSPLELSDFLSKQKQWNISPVHKPYGIHVSVTMANYQSVKNELAKHVQQGIKWMKDKKEIKKSIVSTLYGTSASIPTDGMEMDVLKCLLSASMK